MSITLNGTTGISTPDITSTTAPSLVGTNFTSLPSASLTGALPAISGSSLTSLTSANLTGALPAIDGSALTGISSGYTAKAWVTFVGTGAVSITDDGNVSSLTDSGVGRYTLAFTTALANANYATGAIAKDNSSSTADGGRPKIFVVKGFTDTASSTTGEMVVTSQSNTVNEIDSPLVCCTWSN